MMSLLIWLKQKSYERKDFYCQCLQLELCDYINLADVGINAKYRPPHNNMAIP